MPLSPWIDMEITGESVRTNNGKDALFNGPWIKKMADNFLGGTDPRDPHANPLHADLSGLGSIYIQVGDQELLLDDSRRLAHHARSAGVEVQLDIYPDQQHTFQMMVGRAPEADNAIQTLANWIRPQDSASPTTTISRPRRPHDRTDDRGVRGNHPVGTTNDSVSPTETPTGSSHMIPTAATKWWLRPVVSDPQQLSDDGGTERRPGQQAYEVLIPYLDRGSSPRTPPHPRSAASATTNINGLARHDLPTTTTSSKPQPSESKSR